MREPPASRFTSRATPQPAAGQPQARPEGAAAGSGQAATQSTVRQERENALRNLCEPALPRHALPAETAAFVPGSSQTRAAAQAQHRPHLDDFDQLVASEKAALERPAPQSFDDYDITFEPPVYADDAAYDGDASEERMPPPAAYASRGRPVAHGAGFRSGFKFISSVAGVALLSIAGAVTWNSLFGGSGQDGPVIIAADTEPYREKPEDPGGREIPNQNKAVYQQGAMGAASSPTQENLISVQEEPVDILAEDSESVLPGVSIGQGVIPSDAEADAIDSSGVGDNSGQRIALEPRRVRTVQVRPDGTLVGEAQITAPANAQPEAASQQPSVATASPSDPMAALIASATAERESLAASATMPATGGTAVPPSVLTPVAAPPVAESAPAAPATESVAAMPDAGETQAAVTPETGQPETPVLPETPEAVAAETEEATLPPSVAVVPTPAPARPRPSAQTQVAAVAANSQPVPSAPQSGVYFVQLSAQPTEESARAALKDASARYANILAGHTLSIQTAALGDRGTFYRLRASASNFAEAEQICARLQRAGGECFVTR